MGSGFSCQIRSRFHPPIMAASKAEQQREGQGAKRIFGHALRRSDKVAASNRKKEFLTSTVGTDSG